LHPLQIPSQHFFNPHHRDTLNFYPWVLRNRYLGHRFQGEDSSPENLLLHGPFLSEAQADPYGVLPVSAAAAGESI